MPSFLSRQLVLFVNPRLGLYQRAGVLAAVILALNYALVAVLSVLLMQVCTTTTTTAQTNPVTQSPWSGQATTTGHIKLMADTIRGDGTTTSSNGAVTITKNSTLCTAATFALVGVPFPYAQYLATSNSLGGFGLGASVAEPYAGTSVLVELPCWSMYQACKAGQTWDGSHRNLHRMNMPCIAWDSAIYAGVEFQRFISAVDWCSEEQRLKAIDRFLALRSVPSTLHSDTSIDLSLYCGSAFFVAPGGALGKLYDGSRLAALGENYTGAVGATYTQHWQLNVTTTTTTCPTFAEAFANSFAFCAQIEIVITAALVLLCSQAGCIKKDEGIVDSRKLREDPKLSQALSGRVATAAPMANEPALDSVVA